MSFTCKEPKLRFPEFSGEWERIKIQKLIDNKFIISHLDGNHGELYPKSSEFTKDGIPYISANDFVNGKVDFKNCKYLPEDRAKKFKKGIAHNGDVLFAHNATVGPTALLKTTFDYVVLSTTATYFRCNNDKLLNSFLMTYFNSKNFIKQYSRVMYQSTRNQVPITTQRLFYINLPSKPEQEKIASFLTTVDAKIEQLTCKEKLLEKYKKSAMQKLFSQELRFTCNDGSEYPEWEEKKLREVTIKQASNISANKIEENFGEFIIYGASGILKKVDFYKEENDYISIVKDGAGVGRIFYCKGQSSVLGTMDIISPKIGLNTYFLYCLLENIDFTKYITGSTIPHIYFKDYSNENCLLPSLPEQTKIANFLSAIDKKLLHVKAQLEQTQQFKKALLQQMFV